MVSVTGSTATGRKAIQASARNIKKLGLELGGKNPHIVFADADLDDAADGVAFGMAFNAGQCCVGASRLVVQRPVAEVFTRKLAAKLRRIRVGDPLDDQTQVGALFDQAHLDKVLGYIRSGQAQGAQIVCGGGRTGPAGGFFVEPTLLTEVRRDLPLMREEIFGPVLAVVPFDSYEQALEIANDTEYGLSASIWTRDVNQALRATRDVQAGRVWVNTTLDNGPETPLGGMKQSGLGRDAGLAGIEEYTELKTAHINLQPRAHWIS
jgi:acyl-CoA reductase-like NAD-dependent aldehyde dehydrogenase